MKFYNEIVKTLRPGRAFPNGASWERWAARWCWRCLHEVDCPILAAAVVFEGTPVEWGDTVDGYNCTEYSER